MMGPVVWLEGIIGSGKTTLVKALCRRLPLRALLEPVETNPYLAPFYADPKRWAFAMQIELLHRRYAMQQLAAFEATSEGGYEGAVVDRGLPGDRVFARMHRVAGNISELEWSTYERAYNVMARTLTPPSLLLFIDVEPEIALARIRKRGREAESGLTIEYLQSLRAGYLDLLTEIESGAHAWSRGMETMRLGWNMDNQPVEEIVVMLQKRFNLPRAEWMAR